jgi:hypothetical protein
MTAPVYRLVVQFERSDEMVDLLNEVDFYYEHESNNDPEILNRVSMYAETVLPFELENNHDKDN